MCVYCVAQWADNADLLEPIVAVSFVFVAATCVVDIDTGK